MPSLGSRAAELMGSFPADEVSGGSGSRRAHQFATHCKGPQSPGLHKDIQSPTWHPFGHIACCWKVSQLTWQLVKNST